MESHDDTIQDLIDAIRELMTPEEEPRERIGFALPAAKGNS